MSSIYTDEKLWLEEWSRRKERRRHLVSCVRCLYDEETPNIAFDTEGPTPGLCTYCKADDQLRKQYPGGEKGKRDFELIVEQIKREGKNKPYDVIVGVSGGTDSTYMLHLAKEYGLRALAVHFDNTWNTTIAQQNISNSLKILGFDLWTYVVDNAEYDDIYRGFLKASTPDLEIPTDIALAAVLNMAAEKFKCRYIFEGHSFKTEGMAPLGWIYMDAKYIDSVHKQFGTLPLKTFPNFRFFRQLRWMLFNRLQKIRPLWYLDYDKNKAKELIADLYGWKWYGGHHLENRITAFYHTYYLPRKFDIDMRTLGFSARIRSGQMTRETGMSRMEAAPTSDPDIFELVLKRMGTTVAEFEKTMQLPKRSYRDFKTYKPLFEKLRPFYYLMARWNLIPWSFYIKYTSKENI